MSAINEVASGMTLDAPSAKPPTRSGFIVAQVFYLGKEFVQGFEENIHFFHAHINAILKVSLFIDAFCAIFSSTSLRGIENVH